MNTAEIWKKTKEWISTQIGSTAYEAWFQPLKAKEIAGDKLILEAPDTFFKDWLIDHYSELIQKGLKVTGAEELTVEIRVNSALLDRDDRKRLEAFKSRVQEPRQSLALNPLNTFDNFVVGPSNRFAHAYSLAVAESPQQVAEIIKYVVSL